MIPGNVFMKAIEDMGADVVQVKPEEVASTVQRLLNEGKVVWQWAPDRKPVSVYSISYQTVFRNLATKFKNYKDE